MAEPSAHRHNPPQEEASNGTSFTIKIKHCERDKMISMQIIPRASWLSAADFVDVNDKSCNERGARLVVASLIHTHIFKYLHIFLFSRILVKYLLS